LNNLNWTFSVRRKRPGKEFIIRTLEDYIPTEQFSRDITPEQEYFQQGRDNAILKNMPFIAPIEFYLGGNTAHFYNETIRTKLGEAAAESGPNESQYRHPHVLFEYERIAEPLRNNFMADLGFPWQRRLPGPIWHGDLKNDDESFLNTLLDDLERAHDNIDERNQLLRADFIEYGVDPCANSTVNSHNVC
jgi:hypothetical protein